MSATTAATPAASPDATPDAELVAAVAAGGEAARLAWQILVARYTSRMYAVARSVSLDPATAEDVVQTAWLRLLQRGDQLRDASSVGGWLCTVVRNEAIRVVSRRREIPGDATVSAQLPAEADVASQRLISEERAAALRVAFSRLGPECRELLLLVIADPPLGYDVIAATLGRPRGSLGPTRRRCLDRLRTLLPAGFEDDLPPDDAGSPGDVSGRGAPGSQRRPIRD